MSGSAQNKIRHRKATDPPKQLSLLKQIVTYKKIERRRAKTCEFHEVVSFDCLHHACCVPRRRYRGHAQHAVCGPKIDKDPIRVQIALEIGNLWLWRNQVVVRVNPKGFL